MARDPVRDWVDYVFVDLVGDFTGEMRGPGWHSLTGKCAGALDAEKHRAHGSSENQSFHLHSLLI
jgi:hypothetical protein